MRTFRWLHHTLAVALPIAAGACAAPVYSPLPEGYTFLECGTPPEQGVAVAVANPSVDDSLAVRGHTFGLPRGAVGERQRFKLYDRRTRNVGVDIRPHGYRFESPATITISYARCGDVPNASSLVIVEVRPGTTVPVGPPLPSTVDTRARTVTARIQHLSGYIIGTNRTTLTPP